MAKRIDRPFCTIFKRTEEEKRVWNASKELEAQKEEIAALRAELEALKGSDTKSTSKKKTSNKED